MKRLVTGLLALSLFLAACGQDIFTIGFDWIMI